MPDIEEDIEPPLDSHGYNVLAVAWPTAGALSCWQGMAHRAKPSESGELGSRFSWTYDHWVSPSPLWPQFYHL